MFQALRIDDLSHLVLKLACTWEAFKNFDAKKKKKNFDASTLSLEFKFSWSGVELVTMFLLLLF